MEIQLTQGQVAIVDDRDYERLNQRRWYATVGYATGNIKAFYAKRASKDEGTVYMHRVVWEMHNGPIPEGMEIDHINGNGLDNRLENLRLCNRSQNNANQHTIRPHTSKYKGVHWDKYHKGKKWCAQIGSNGRVTTIGYFATETEAARAYDKMAREKWGERAALNFPTSSSR